MTSSKILFFLCLAFIAGIFLESIVKIPQSFLWTFLSAGILFIFLGIMSFPRKRESSRHCEEGPIAERGGLTKQSQTSRLLRRFVPRNDNVVVIGFCLLLFILGVLRVQIAEFNILNDKLSKLNDSGEEVILEGVIIKEPDIREKSQRIKVKIDDSIVLVTANRYPEYKYSDKIKITGKLQTPMETEDFSYKNYLLKDHIYSVVYFPKIEIIGKANSSPISAAYSGILWVKQKMRQSIRNNFLPPHSSILEEMILGDKSVLSQNTKDKFRITGLSHIIAVSGMHVVILSTIIMFFLLFFGLWRNQAFYAAVVFILIYVVLVGLPSSAVRAGIMGIVFLLGQKLGRQTMSERVIVLAAGFMLFLNPLLLFYDIGFQLSFLAVLGLIFLEPILRNFIKFLIFILLRLKIREKYENFLMLFTVTTAAQIFTLPVIIFNFGNVSFVSLFANILILPAVPGIMFFGFLSALAGTILGFLGQFLSFPCYFLLTYVFWLVDAFSKPWAYKLITNVSWVWVAFSYIFLGVFIKYFNKKLKMKFLDY